MNLLISTSIGHLMQKEFRYALVIASVICVGSIFLIVSDATYAQALSSLPTEKIWKLTANGEKADLKIDKPPGADGWIMGTAHWFGRDGTDPYTAKIFGYWDEAAWKITFLQENELKFDKPRIPDEELNCNPVDKAGKICHGRDQLYTGYLFGGSPGGPTEPKTLAGSWVGFGGTAGIGATAERNVFGWCATYEVDLCAPLRGTSYEGQTLATNITNMSNDKMTAK